MQVDQQVAMLLGQPAIQAAFQEIDAGLNDVIELTLALSHLPSPTFAEAEKADFVLQRFRRLGLADSHIDAAGNVIGRRPGRAGGGSILLAAHIDTVFPLGTALTGHRDNGYLRGPAVGDNSLGVAALVALATAFDRAELVTERDLLFVADVGEEGLGDLRGMRQVMDTYGGEVKAALAIEGHTLGRVTHRAVGSRRLRLTVNGPGGHSWGDFGRPSAIHLLAQLITQLGQLPVTQAPRSTFNVGRIEGGVSINTIAPTAWCELDLRSEDQAELERLVGWVEQALTRRLPREMTIEIATIGDRSAGAIAADAPIVTICCAALRALGIEPTLEASSTDANLPIGLGVPAVCLGITRGAGAHRVEEFVEIQPIASGLRQLLLTTAILAQVVGRPPR
jgi:acetylornithine deacetylase/succinyl-diaminopimelate desuccinylase-like protein